MTEPVEPRVATPQACQGCGVKAARRKDAKGIDQLNISPQLGLCIECIVAKLNMLKTFRTRRIVAPSPPVFDVRAVQARNDE